MFGRADPFCAILVEVIMRNISVKIILNLDQWYSLEEMSFKDNSYLELWKRNRTICAILIEGIIETILVK